ncbi:hypothetical protein WN48_00520 [Eufriesea mexicana]|nr:hypothetical protein WN48_00520 [Eufriesea mexicana]
MLVPRFMDAVAPLEQRGARREGEDEKQKKKGVKSGGKKGRKALEGRKGIGRVGCVAKIKSNAKLRAWEDPAPS